MIEGGRDGGGEGVINNRQSSDRVLATQPRSQYSDYKWDLNIHMHILLWCQTNILILIGHQHCLYKTLPPDPIQYLPCAYFEPSVLFCTDFNQETDHDIFIWQTGRAISISREMEPGVCIPGLSSIFKIDEEEMAAAMNILCMDLTSLMSISPAKKCMQS